MIFCGLKFVSGFFVVLRTLFNSFCNEYISSFSSLRKILGVFFNLIL